MVLMFRFTDPEAYSKTCQTSKMKLFVNMVNDYKPLNIFAKSSMLDVWQGSEYASGIHLVSC